MCGRRPVRFEVDRDRVSEKAGVPPGLIAAAPLPREAAITEECRFEPGKFLTTFETGVIGYVVRAKR
jgi:hypothetical protein